MEQKVKGTAEEVLDLIWDSLRNSKVPKEDHIKMAFDLYLHYLANGSLPQEVVLTGLWKPVRKNFNECSKKDSKPTLKFMLPQYFQEEAKIL